MEDVFKLLGFHSLGILLGGTLFLFADAFAKHQSPLKKALYGPLTGTEIRVWRALWRSAGLVIAAASAIWLVYNLVVLLK